MEQPIESQSESVTPLPPVLPGVVTLIKVSLRFYRDIFSKISPFLTISYLVSSLILFLSYHGNTYLAISVLIINVLIASIIYIALIRVISGAEHDAGDIVGNLTKSTKLLGGYMWISILSVSIMLGGSVFLLIPGIIATIYIFLAVYAFVTENKKGFEALFTSWEYINGRWLQVFLRLIGFSIFFLLCLMLVTIVLVAFGVPLQDSSAAVSFGSGLIQQFIQTFFFMPLNLVFMYILFISLKSTSLHPTQLAMSRARKIFKTLCVIGLVVIIILSIGGSVVSIKNLRGSQFQFINTITTHLNL